MPVYLRGIWSGAAGSQHILHLLGHTDAVGFYRRILQRIRSRILGGESRGPNVPENFQCGGGHGGVPLGISGGGVRGRLVRFG